MLTARCFVVAGLIASLGFGYAFVLPHVLDSHAQDAKKPAAGGAGVYAIDAVHSTVHFKVKHANTSWFIGRFDGKEGTVQLDPAAPEKSSVDVTIAVDSIDTGNGDRDKHLKSAEFFDAAQFPKATFKSKSVAKKGNALAVSGDLSLHGVTKPVTIDMEQTGSGEMMGSSIVGFFGTLAIKRSDFGMKSYLDMLGDDVTLTISIEAAKK